MNLCYQMYTYKQENVYNVLGKQIRESVLFKNPLIDSERATMLSNLDLVSRNQFRLRFTTPPAVHLLRPLPRGAFSERKDGRNLTGHCNKVSATELLPKFKFVANGHLVT